MGEVPTVAHQFVPSPAAAAHTIVLTTSGGAGADASLLQQIRSSGALPSYAAAVGPLATADDHVVHQAHAVTGTV